MFLTLASLAALAASRDQLPPRAEEKPPEDPGSRVVFSNYDAGHALSLAVDQMESAGRGVFVLSAGEPIVPKFLPPPGEPPLAVALAEDRRRRKRERNLAVKARGGIR